MIGGFIDKNITMALFTCIMYATDVINIDQQGHALIPSPLFIKETF